MSTFAALALGFGFVVGTAISPNLGGIIAAPSPTVVAQAPPSRDTSTPRDRWRGRGRRARWPAVAPGRDLRLDDRVSGGGGSSGGGGGGGKKKKQKTQPIEFTGTVVRVNSVAQSYTLASNGGLIAIHANTLPKVGDQVQSPVRKLKNGTYAEQGNRAVQGQTDNANFLGTVSFCADLRASQHPVQQHAAKL